ncbi:phage tail protein [Ideonella sp. 4Y16]|uniref:phage tail protein n=1 Tax=Ideonella alba TaxID=2824118 RepID=UPI001B38F944|nr:tail fiber protein [Ideonella alba]MBQ0945629.1 phage tail protein [Ideonella alba]
MSDQFIAEVRMFAGNFAPAGWAFCEGQVLPISQNTALFSLLGTTYGGDGQTTFALPNLSNRVPIQAGQGPGLSPRDLGRVGGAERAVLNQNYLPAHGHTAMASAQATQTSPSPSASLATVSENLPAYRADPGPGLLVDMGFPSVLPAGAGASVTHNNLPPVLKLSFIIALQGVWPQRP